MRSRMCRWGEKWVWERFVEKDGGEIVLVEERFGGVFFGGFGFGGL